jgi:hypothetical protein
VPKPDALLPVAVAITYCTVALVLEPLPKCCAALTASAASCVSVGWAGAAEVLSNQVAT